MKKLNILVLLLMSVLILVACGASETDAPEADAQCIAPQADEQQVTSETFGICLVAPADFTYEQQSETNGNLFFNSMMDVEHPKLLIDVMDAGGKTTEEAADEFIASFEGFDIQRSSVTLGNEPAVRLDGVPGQDLGRVLLAVHNDRLYRLTFVPADPTQGDVYAQMESLFIQVSDSFRFLP